MQQRESSGSPGATVPFLMCLAGGIAIALMLLWPRSTAAIAPDAPTAAAVPAPTETDNAHLTPPPDIDRVAAAIPTAEQQAASEPPLVFAQCVAKLCELGLRTAELAQDDEIDAAKLVDAETRRLLAALLQQFADAGERSLAMLIEMAGGPDVTERQPLENTKLGVLQLLLQTELSRRHELASQVQDPSRVNSLVQSLLDAMPIGSLTAQMGDRCLHQAPYLRMVHEVSVLNLLKLASEEQFPREIATNMLLTLWDNVKATGERTSAELTQLAMLRLDGSDPSQIILACRELLADARYRAVALAWLRERKDMQLAGEIAQLAARELPVRDALDVLRELAPLVRHTRGAYTGLGVRAPELLADAYREHLAANNYPDIRRELIMGVGMLPDPAGMQLAELALANDPSPEVRIQAMFVFTVHATPEASEQAINQLLDNPEVANSPQLLSAVVGALNNLEHGDLNTVARLGARLQNMALADYSREALAEILARCLPAGTTPSGG